MLNDTYRISTVHTESMQGMDNSAVSPEAVVNAVVSAFSSLSETAVKHMTRVIFADMTSVLLEFDSQWTDPATGSSVIKRIVQGLSKATKDIRPKLETIYFLRVLNGCADVAVLRYLIFIKDKSTKHSKLTASEVVRFQSDAEALSKFLTEAVAATSSSSSSSLFLSRQKTCLQDVVDLLTTDAESKAFLTLLQTMITKYIPLANTSTAGGHGNGNIGMHVCVAVIAVRPDSSSTLSSLVDIVAAEVKANVPMIGDHPVEADDLLSRVFGASAGGGGGGGGGSGFDDGDNYTDPPANTSLGIGIASTLSIAIGTPSRSKSRGGGGARDSLRSATTPLKQLREKASDLLDMAALGDKATRRKNEDFAVGIMRRLGLEDDYAGSGSGSGSGAGGLREESEDGGDHSDDDDGGMSVISGISDLNSIGMGLGKGSQLCYS